jgi:hypothetical protein
LLAYLGKINAHRPLPDRFFRVSNPSPSRRSPSGFTPSGSLHPAHQRTEKFALTFRPISVRSPSAEVFLISTAIGSSFLVRYIPSGLLFL